MKDIVLVTGNPNKLRELQEMVLEGVHFQSRDLHLHEIQSLDQHGIIKDKLERAYDDVQGPVIVEDVSAELQSLNGLPGPFIKFFEEQLGAGALYKLSKVKNDKVTIRCLAGYYDGKQMLFGKGVLHGTVVAPRGNNGFGFDCVIVLDGETRTMAEMPPEEKNSISHRHQAFSALLKQLKTLG